MHLNLQHPLLPRLRHVKAVWEVSDYQSVTALEALAHDNTGLWALTMQCCCALNLAQWAHGSVEGEAGLGRLPGRSPVEGRGGEGGRSIKCHQTANRSQENALVKSTIFGEGHFSDSPQASSVLPSPSPAFHARGGGCMTHDMTGFINTLMLVLASNRRSFSRALRGLASTACLKHNQLPLLPEPPCISNGELFSCRCQ
jgi:hypothetical protein